MTKVLAQGHSTRAGVGKHVGKCYDLLTTINPGPAGVNALHILTFSCISQSPFL